MARIGKHKKKYDAYKLGGHKIINKKLKQERHEKRMAAFEKRKEAGLTYKYAPITFPKDSYEYNQERMIRAEKCKNRKLPEAKMRSIMAKLNNYLEKKTLEVKELKERKSKKNEKAVTAQDEVNYGYIKRYCRINPR